MLGECFREACGGLGGLGECFGMLGVLGETWGGLGNARGSWGVLKVIGGPRKYHAWIFLCTYLVYTHM